MPISFDNIPNNIRVPLAYVEFNSQQALSGAITQPRKTLFFGQQLSTATATAGALTQVLSADQADTLYARGSMLAEMFRHAKTANRLIDTWAVGLEDAGTGVAATGKLSITGPATAAGTLVIYIAGQRVTVGVDSADAATAIATAVAAALNAVDTLPVTAAVNGTNTYEVDLTAKHKGEAGNGIDVRLNYYTGESLPAGVGVTVTAMSGGTTNPDITSVLTAIGDEKFDTIVMPYTDSVNLALLEAELDTRFGPIEQIDGIAYIAFRGTAAASTTFGTGRNSKSVSCMGTSTAPQPPYIWAAVNAVVAEAALAIDPARPLQTLVLPGILPPAVTDRFTWEERNLLLFDGISTYNVNAAGQVQIERQITMYQENAGGFADPSYLDVNTPVTLGYIRQQINARMVQKFPRHKLANDGTPVAPGQAIVTPSVIRAELIALARELNTAGIVENLEQFATALVVERNASDVNRVDVLLSPDLVNQFRVFAGQVQFLL